jgi:hypothetical protein
LNDDTKSVISHSSRLSKGYYRAPRSNYKQGIFKNDKKEVDNNKIGRTITSEYNYSGILILSFVLNINFYKDSKAFSKQAKLNQRESSDNYYVRRTNKNTSNQLGQTR